MNVSGQHERQDERLTRQSPNQGGHCPLTGLGAWKKALSDG